MCEWVIPFEGGLTHGNFFKKMIEHPAPPGQPKCSTIPGAAIRSRPINVKWGWKNEAFEK
jgi:hypothetical protein